MQGWEMETGLVVTVFVPNAFDSHVYNTYYHYIFIIVNFTVEGSKLNFIFCILGVSCMRSSCLLIMTHFSLWRFSFFRTYYSRLEHIGGHLFSCSFISSSEPHLSIKLPSAVLLSHLFFHLKLFCPLPSDLSQAVTSTGLLSMALCC